MKVCVKAFCVRCFTREKGKKFYRYLRQQNQKQMTIDFSGVEYVSIAFLDESLWKLAEEGFSIIIYDPAQVLMNKLEKISIWTKSSVHISKREQYYELINQ